MPEVVYDDEHSRQTEVVLVWSKGHDSMPDSVAVDGHISVDRCSCIVYKLWLIQQSSPNLLHVLQYSCSIVCPANKHKKSFVHVYRIAKDSNETVEQMDSVTETQIRHVIHVYHSSCLSRIRVCMLVGQLSRSHVTLSMLLDQLYLVSLQ
jgi:hypothetical protein